MHSKIYLLGVRHETLGLQHMPPGTQRQFEGTKYISNKVLIWLNLDNLFFFSDVQLSSKFTSAGLIGAFHVLFLNYMLHMLEYNKFDISNTNKWLQNWPLVNNSPAAFTCNYFAQEFNLLDIKVMLNERALHNDL